MRTSLRRRATAIACGCIANIALYNDVPLALQYGAEGIGLLRSEFSFLTYEDFPDEDQQIALYNRMLQAFGQRPVTIRTLDIGADKYPPYMRVPREENPFLGWRSIRISLEMSGLFKVQLRAILRAATRFNVRIMFPMISSLEELRRAKELLAEAQAELYNDNPVTLPTNRQAQQVMNKGQELIEEKEYAKACEALQFLPGVKDDSFVQVARAVPGQKRADLWVSIPGGGQPTDRHHAGRGVEGFEELYGREAAARLAKGRTANDPQSWPRLPSGLPHRSRGEGPDCCPPGPWNAMSSSWPPFISSPPGPARCRPPWRFVLVQGRPGLHRAGERGNGEDAWKLLAVKAKRDGGVSLGEQVVSLDRLRDEIDKVAKDEPRSVHDWATYRGSPNRTGRPSPARSTWNIDLEPVHAFAEARQCALLERGTGQRRLEAPRTAEPADPSRPASDCRGRQGLPAHTTAFMRPTSTARTPAITPGG